MIRSIFDKLIAWKDESGRKPLLLRGVRQVGKTWLMKEFGRTRFKHLAYINCDSNELIAELFAHDFDMNRIISMLGVAARVPMLPGETLSINR